MHSLLGNSYLVVKPPYDVYLWKSASKIQPRVKGPKQYLFGVLHTHTLNFVLRAFHLAPGIPKNGSPYSHTHSVSLTKITLNLPIYTGFTLPWMRAVCFLCTGIHPDMIWEITKAKHFGGQQHIGVVSSNLNWVYNICFNWDWLLEAHLANLGLGRSLLLCNSLPRKVYLVTALLSFQCKYIFILPDV